jgi:amidase
MGIDRHNLTDQPLAALAEAMAAGSLTAVDLVGAYLERIARHNHDGARINAVGEINPDVLLVAEALDDERRRQGVRGPLHGMPILLKDNIDTGDGLHTTAGSLALKDSWAERDAPVAARLRAAGAIILGKANMTEWANFMSDHMPNGYSSRGGQVLNPYGPGRIDPGGSSSGSAAGVAAGFAVAAVGTETSGSILSPASQQALVGLKPTLGLISRTGIVPIAHSQDTAGPIARTVEDVAILLDAMVGEDPLDPATWRLAGRVPPTYRACLGRRGMAGARVGLPARIWAKVPEPMRAVALDAVRALKHLGADVVEDVELDGYEALPGWTVLEYEFKGDLNRYLARLSPAVPVHSLRDVIAFNLAHADRCLRYGQSQLLASEATSGTLTEAAYWEARFKDWNGARHAVDGALTQYRLKALVVPGAWGAAVGAKAGYPSLTVPAGFTEVGEPVGLTFMAGAFEEPVLLALGYAFEQATAFRRPPALE